ncbi:MAG: trigger factor [Limisphaerales bacterium]
MNVTVENLGPCKKLLRVELETQKVDETFDEVAKDFSKHARLPGFRPGKAPKEMVLKKYDAEIQEEVKRKLISNAYHKAVKDQNLTVVGAPDVEEIQFAKGQPLQFAATIETAPDFELPEYKGLSAKREQSSVTEADVDNAINLLRDRVGDFKNQTRPLQKGDFAVINYKGSSEGKPLTEIAPTARGLTEQKAFWVEVKENSFIPGFADQLIGMNIGDKRTVNVDFPADFVSAPLAGKKGTYEVDLVEVKEKVLPALDEAFAKQYGAENMDKLREGVRADLQNELNTKQSRAIRNQVTEELLKKVNVELPETLVQHETRSIVYNLVNENQQRGVPKEALEAKKDDIYKNANNMAKERVKASFIFQKIAAKEGVRVEQMEIAGRLQAMAAQYQVPVDKLVKDLEKADRLQDIYSQLLTEKVIELLVQNAKVEDVPAATKA